MDVVEACEAVRIPVSKELLNERYLGLERDVKGQLACERPKLDE